MNIHNSKNNVQSMFQNTQNSINKDSCHILCYIKHDNVVLLVYNDTTDKAQFSHEKQNMSSP